MAARYAVVLTRIRQVTRRDERTDPEWVICTGEVEERSDALRTARRWASSAPVRNGQERVKTVALDA